MSWTACEPLSSLVLSVNPALVLSPDGAQLLWANPAGAKRLGTQDLETLLSEEFPQGFPLRKQIRPLFNWLHNDKEQIQRLRLGRSASTPLEMVNVRKLRNIEGSPGVLLRPVASVADQSFQHRSEVLADWLGSGHHYAALFNNSGDVIASSGAFHELRYAAKALQELLDEAEDSAFPVSQQVTIESGTRHLVTALRLPTSQDAVFLLLVDAADAPLKGVAQTSGQKQAAEQSRPANASANPTGQLAASQIRVPKPANDTQPTPTAPKSPVDRPKDNKATSEPDLMRFVWRMDDAFKFTFVSPEFQTLVGLRGAIEGRTWQDLAGDFQLDPDGEVQETISSKDIWSGTHISWVLPKRKKVADIELSAMPVFDSEKRFMGYRGFGACQLRDEEPEIIEVPVQDNHVATPQDSRSVETLPDGLQQDTYQADVFETLEPGLDSGDRMRGAPADAERSDRGVDVASGDEVDAADEVPAIIDTRPSQADTKSPRQNAGQVSGLTPDERRAFEEIGKSLGKQTQTRPVSPSASGKTEKRNRVHNSPPQSVTPSAAMESPAASGRTPAAIEDRQTELALRTMLDRVDTGVLVVREDQVLFANTALARMVGYHSAQAYLEANAAAPMAGFSLDRVDDDGTMKLTGKDDVSHTVRAAIEPMDWDNQPASLLTVHPVKASDVPSASQMAVGDRIWTADELLAILNTATEGVLMIDAEGKILALNHGAEALFDENQANLVGRDLTTLLALESHKPARDYLAGITGAGVASVLNDGREVIGQTAKGGYMPLFMTVGRVGEASAENLSDMRLCVVLRDITQWKRAEDDLIAARHNAEEANTAKSDFLARISHEIRTPLNAILGFSEVMLEERFGPIGNPRYKDYINDIHTSGAHVINLVNDMLDISKIEAGQLELSFTAVDLVAVLKECVALMQPQANEGRVIIRTSFSDDLPRVVADAKTVRQIALNLLSNSIKFTAEGGQVIVSAVVEKDGSLIVRVRDTGVGMTEADLAKAMEPFRQIEQSGQTGAARTSAATGGTGLGLPLTKALVEANRAQFLIESTPSKGTLIRVVFPNTRVLAE